MTPTTTPAPMTHEEALDVMARAISALEGQMCGEGQLAGELDDVGVYLNAERTRADALAAEVERAQDELDLFAEERDELRLAIRAREARIAELAAVVGRMIDAREGLAYEDGLLAEARRLIGREALRGQEPRSLIGHKEGRR